MRADSGQLRIGVLASHPIQYQAPIFRELAKQCDLTVFFAHSQEPQAQAAAGFGVPFDWDIDLFTGYRHEFLRNVARQPGVGRFFGCDTPEVGGRMLHAHFDAFVVLGWHLKCFWQAVAACRSLGVPVLCRGDSHLHTPRPAPLRWAKSLIYPALLRRFDGHLYVGRRNREYLAYYGVPDSRLFFAPHCVDVRRFGHDASRLDRAHRRTAWGAAGPGTHVILFAGKLVESKRPQDLIAAASRLSRSARDVLVVYAGDGPMRTHLENLGREHRVKTTFLGFCNQSELAAVYGAADVLVLPSQSESWGLVVNEAMASGTPCIVSHACGCAPDMVEGKGSGIVYPCGNIDQLAAAMEAVLDRQGAFRASLPAVNETYSPECAARGIVRAAEALSRVPSPGAGPAVRGET